MKLSDEQIRRFIECWKEDFGEELTMEDAGVEAMRLLDFFAALAELLRRPRRAPTPPR